MLDPWFKKSYPIKHLKKQFYWWIRQGAILRNAKQFVLLQRRNAGWLKVLSFLTVQRSGNWLGGKRPSTRGDEQRLHILRQFPNLRDRKILLYLGRFHPKKGVDDLIRAWKKLSIKDSDILVLAGPMEENNPWINHLKKLAGQTLLFIGRVCWRVN